MRRSRRTHPDRRPWYRVDLFDALDRLYAYLRDLIDLDPARITSDRRPTAKLELLGLEPRAMLDGRPLPFPVLFVGAGPGMDPVITAYEADTGAVKFTKTVYADSFRGGVRVAAADFNQDGYPDLLVAPGAGGGPNIRIYDGKTGNQIAGPLGSFWAFDPSFQGGVNIAAADVDGDGFPDAIVAAGPGGGPRVRVFSGATGAVIADFFALDAEFRGGISVAAADLTGDGKAEIAIGAGEGGGPRVKVYNPLTQQPIAGPLGSFFAFDDTFRGGVYVGSDALAGDVNGDGTFDLAVGSGPGMASAVKVYSGATGAVLREISPFGSFAGGVRVALAYADNDGFADILTGSGPGMNATVRVFSGATGKQLDNPIGQYVPFGSATGGVYVAGSNDPAYIAAYAWFDANGNHSVDSGESPASSITVTLSLNGTQIDSKTSDTLGNCYFTNLSSNTNYTVDAVAPNGYASEGPYTVNTGSGGGSVQLGLLPASPPPPTISGFNDDTGYSASDRLTNDTTLTIFGTAPASSSVAVSDRSSAGSGGSTALGTVTSSAGGLWTLTYATALAEGSHLLTATSGSVASNVYRLAIDATAPAVALVAPSTTYENAPEIRVQASDLYGIPSGATVTLDVDLNNDGNYTDAGETGYAAATMANGLAVFTGYTALTVGNTVRMRARVTDAAGNEGSSSNSSLTVGISPTDWHHWLPHDPQYVSAPSQRLSDGTVTAFVPLDLDRSPSPAMGSASGLTYVSSEAGQAPTIEFSVQSNNALAAPTQVVATLTWDGSSSGSRTFSGSGLMPGAIWNFDLQPASNQSTGLHTYSFAAFIDYPGTINDVIATSSGSTFVVNRSSAAAGAGWALAEVDQLIGVAATGSVPAGEMRIEGNGQWAYYTLSGGNYTSPVGDAGTLATAGGGYTYTLPSGEQRIFDSSGYQTKWASADGATTKAYTYDGSNRVSTATSPDGGVATFAYSSGLLATVTAPGNRVTSFAYSGTDLTLVTDAAGGLHTLAYDGSHRLTDEKWGSLRTTYGYLSGMGVRTSIGGEVRTVQPVLGAALTAGVSSDVWVQETDGLGALTRTRLDELGYPVERIDPDGADWKMARDSNGRLTALTDPLGQTTTYTRDASGYVTAIQNPDATRATFTYQVGHHALTTAVDELNRTTTYTYTASGNLETTTDPNGGVTTLTWSLGLLQTIADPLGRVVTETYDSYRRLTNALVGGAQTGTMLYDSWGNKAGVTDPLGATTTLANDAVGRPVSQTTPDGATTTVIYDAAGLTIGTILPSGLRTSFAYGESGRQTSMVEAVGDGLERRTTSVYDAAGHRIAIVDPLGNRTTAVYDALGRVTAVVDPLLQTSSTQFDLAGRATTSIDPLGRVTLYGYDGRDRRTTVTDPLGNVTSVVYDAAGNKTAVVDPLGNRATAVYDALNRVIASVDPLGNRSTAIYDPAGQLVASLDPLGNRTTTVYDARGRVSTVTDALLNVTTAAYDAADRLVAVTDPLGRTATSVYDSTGHVIASIDPLGNRTSAVYDSAGRLSASLDPLGNRTTAVYDSLDRVTSTIDALGNRTTAIYDALDRVIANVDPLGNRTTAVFDAASRVVAAINPLGNATTSTYDVAGNVTSLTDARGNVTGYSFNANNLLVNTVDPLGNVSTSTYDAASRLTSLTDPLGRTSTAVYDAASRLVAAVDALGNRGTSAYDAAGNRTAHTDPLLHTTTIVYDALNRPIAAIDPLGNRTTAVYDVAGQFVAVIDALNRRTTLVHDDASRLIAIVDPLGNRSTSVYDAAGNAIASVDPLGNRSTAVYDSLNRIVASIDALGNRGTVAYDAAGRVRSVIDPLNHTNTFNYDAAGRRTSTLDGLERSWQTVFDATGNAAASVDSLGNRTTVAYDADNRAIGHIDALGNRATVVYDAAGQISAGIDPLNHRTTSLYDAAGRITTTIDALGNRTTATYDNAGRTASLIDPVGNRTTWAYDAANRLVTETDPLNANRTYAYDAVGQLTSTTDRLGRRKDYSYDLAGHRNTESWFAVGGAQTQTQTFTYDGAGRLTSAADPDGTYTLAYDAANRVSHVAEPFGLGLTMGYDAASNRTSVQDSLGGVTTATFDARNMQTAKELGGTGITPIKDVRAYDDAGRLTSDTRQKSSSGFWSTVATTTYAYDAVSRVTGITTANAMLTTLATYAYSYDAANRLLAKVDNGATTSYAYDLTSQLTQDGTTTFGYDANGNRTNTGYATAAGNRTSTDGVWTYTYDAEGSVTKKSKGAANDTWTYAYDNNNQMTAAAFSATDGGSVTKRVTYVYDAFGNRIERDAWDGTTVTVERYGLDGWDPAKPRAIGNENFDAWVDLNGSNTLTMRRMFGPDFVVPVASETSAGAVSWYGTDLQGSVRLVFDNSGSITSALAYDAAGKLLSGTLPDRFGFGRMQYDSLASFGLTPSRVYFPEMGRFSQEDPLGLVPDSNRHRYVGNSLTNFTDPSGMKEKPYPLSPEEQAHLYTLPTSQYLVAMMRVERGAPPFGPIPLPPSPQPYRGGSISPRQDNPYAIYLTPLSQHMRSVDQVSGALASVPNALIVQPVYRTVQFVGDLPRAAFDPYYQPNNPYFRAYLNGDMSWSNYRALVGDAVATTTILGAARGLIPGRAGTVWDSIKGTQPVYEKTVIPQSFQLQTANGTVWVHPNGSKHLAEYATANLGRGVQPSLVNIGTQQQLASLQAAVNQALANGVKYGEIVNVAGWELKFGAPGQTGDLPVLFHALLK